MTRADAEHLGAGVILLRGSAISEMYYLVSVAIKQLQRDGYRPSPHVLNLQEELRLGALDAKDELSRRRQRDVAKPPIPQGLSIGSTEAAEILGCSRRHVQRIASSLDGRKGSAGALIFDRNVVMAYCGARGSVA
uniref:hypothetical protein n=1 Tax=Rhodococcus qingshengii TaxID=334542 RepID=UPI001C4E03EA|nr:hypothetical protein [Rhodococcus qingshengii]